MFTSDLFGSYISALLAGMASGFTLGFIAWAIGYAIYAFIKFFKMA